MPERKHTSLDHDPYADAKVAYQSQLQTLIESGKVAVPSDSTDEADVDDYFDFLTYLYRESCAERGLCWPPPAARLEGSSTFIANEIDVGW